MNEDDIDFEITARTTPESAISVALHLFFPLGSVARRLGIHIPDPFRLVGYRCRNQEGVFHCRGGPYFSFCDPGHDPGVAEIIERLECGDFIDVGAHSASSLSRHPDAWSTVAARFPLSRTRDACLSPEDMALNLVGTVVCLPYAAAGRHGRAVLYEPVSTFGPHPRDTSFAESGGKPFEGEAEPSTVSARR
jgi:hypothetical protein